MKQISLIGAYIAVVALLFTSCGGNSDGRQKSQKLPVLTANERSLFENDALRIVEEDGMETEGWVYNILKVHPKQSTIKNFQIEGTILSFESVIGNTMLVSEGTSTLRTLLPYDLTTGEKIFDIEYNFSSDPGIDVNNDYQFSFYTYEETLPTISWDEQTKSWKSPNELPEIVQNADLEKVKKEAEENLFDGFSLMAYRKVKVDLKERTATPVDEYKWGYLE